MRARAAELLCHEGVEADVPPPGGPRRSVMLHWEPASDELAFSDGTHSGVELLGRLGTVERRASFGEGDTGSSDGRVGWDGCCDACWPTMA
jgi:hypothetical protein